MKNTNRREFVKNVSGAALAASIFPLTGSSTTDYVVEKRVLGKTGEMVSIMGIGGYHIGRDTISDDESIEIMRNAIDNGINFMDNAWSYQKGRSEELMGRALKDGYRKKVLLMTKMRARTVDGVKKQLETSLERFKLDSFDLMQFHAIGNVEGDVNAIYNSGLIEWAEDMRSQGVFKYIGFTGHADAKALVDMIKRGYSWDTVQMPLNIGDVHREVGFQKDVLPLAIENNIGVIAMKTNGFGNLSSSGIATPVEGLRYAMSLPISTAVSGIDSLGILNENLTLAKNFRAMSDAEKDELTARSKGLADKIEHYLKK